MSEVGTGRFRLENNEMGKQWYRQDLACLGLGALLGETFS